MLFFQGTCIADIFKYKDENGRWQFSDAPKKTAGSQTVQSYRGFNSSSKNTRDFVALLNDKYSPNNPVQKATMAVVTVKSRLGSGSGFFVTDDCYLITNKHVVRPAKGKQWDVTEAKIKQSALMFERKKRQIANQQERLLINKQRLDDFRLYMHGLSFEKERQVSQREYSLYEQQYQQDEQQFNEASSQLNEAELKFKQQQSTFNFSSAISNVAQSFEIILKDNTKAQAKLIRVAPKDDLALLKVDACKAPYLEISAQRVSQGTAVHAIGSPLGLRDQLTEGTVTQISTMGIATDAQILPGNSGGPLITDNGHVVAVNTIKVAQGSALNTGFGVSIPIAKVKQNFGDYLK